MASAGTPVMTVMDISRVVARANVPQEQALHVKIGSPATLTVANSVFQLSGKVSVVSPATDPQSTTIQVWVQADNPGERLKPGMPVHVAIVADTIPNAVLVPNAALLPASDGGTSIMTVTPDNLAHERKVTVGVREGDKVQIQSGVGAGEQVIVVGGVGLQDKAKVKIVKPGENPDEEKGAAENPKK
jgi:RND family efflux transporter MFP subunit